MNYILKHNYANGLVFQFKNCSNDMEMFKVITYKCTASCDNVAISDFSNFESDVHVVIKHGKMFFSKLYIIFTPADFCQ